MSAQDDDGWIDADDTSGDAGGAWIDVAPEEIQPEPTEPETTPSAEGADPRAGGEAPATVDDGAAAPPPAPAPAPAQPDPAEQALTCPTVVIPRPPQKPGPEGFERLLVLPLQDNAGDPQGAAALTAATVDGISVIEDLDYTDPGQLTRDEDDDLINPPPAEPLATDRLRFEVVDARCLEGKVSAEVFEGFTACSRGRCMADLAEAVGADFIVYGQLAKAAPPLLLYELKLYDHGLGRIVGRATAEAPNARYLAAAAPQVIDQLIAPPPPPPPRPAPPKEPSLLESPLLIGGVTVSLAGTVLGLGALGWLASAEYALWTPEIHRDLKRDALTYWPYVAGAAAVAPVIILAGVVLMGVSPLFLPDAKDPPAAGAEGQE